jgi:VWFA-related protein
LRDRLLKATGRKAIVVLSDGVDTGSRKASRESVLELITRTGVVSYSVRYETRNDGTRQIRPSDLPSLGNGRANLAPPKQQPRGTYQKQKPVDRDLIGIEFLQAIATRSGALFIRSENSAMTAIALNQIAGEIRNQYTVTYDPKNDKADGTFREISVELPGGGYRVRARQGYIAPKAPEPKK